MKFQVGNIVLVRENSLQVVEDTIGYVYYTYTENVRGHNYKIQKGKSYVWLITEDGQEIRLTLEEATRSLVIIAQSKYIYEYEVYPSSTYQQKIGWLDAWIKKGTFFQIIGAYGERVVELDHHIRTSAAPGFWTIKD